MKRLQEGHYIQKSSQEIVTLDNRIGKSVRTYVCIFKVDNMS